MRWMECAIVDDNKFDRLICSKILEKIGSEVETIEFQTGKEILAFLTDNEPRRNPLLVLLDLNMPEMSGYEFLEAVMKDEHAVEKMRWVRVAIITSSTRIEDRERSMSFPYVVGFLQKPILIAQLEDLLNSSEEIFDLT